MKKSIRRYLFLCAYLIGACVLLSPGTVKGKTESDDFRILVATSACTYDTITFSADNQVPGFTYAWSFGDGATGTGGIVTHFYQNTGTYTVTLVLTDTLGCVTTSSQNIDIYEILLPQINIIQPGCLSQIGGSIEVIATGGLAPYSYSIDGGINFQSSNLFSSLPPGVYLLYVQDSLGCSAATTVTLVNPPPIVVISTITNATCSTSPNGAIDLTLLGGTPPFSYVWSNGDTVQDLVNALSGTYTVTITDANGCTEIASMVIGEQMQPSGGPDVIRCRNTPCVQIGLPNNLQWQYLWYYYNGGSQNPITAGLTPTICVAPNNSRTYYLTITDPGTGCVVYDTVQVTVRPPNHPDCRVAKTETAAQGPDDEIDAQKKAVAIFPNPFQDKMFVELEMPEEDILEVIVYDLNGHLIKVLHSGIAQAGRHRLTWNGTGTAGNIVSGGVYLLQMNISGRKESARVVYLR